MSNLKREYKRTIDEETKKLFDKFFSIDFEEYGKAVINVAKGLDILGFTLYRDYPNILVSGNNKLVEILHEFEDRGLSLFALCNEKENRVEQNLVGNAIIEDIKGRVVEGIDGTVGLLNFIESICERMKKNSEQIVNMTYFQTLKLNLANLLVPGITEPLIGPTDEELKAIDEYLMEHEKRDDEIFKYDYRKEIVPAVASMIEEMYGSERDYLYYGRPDRVIPILKKLGLEDQIPVLKAELAKRKIPASVLYPKTAQSEQQTKKPIKPLKMVRIDTGIEDVDDGDIDY